MSVEPHIRAARELEKVLYEWANEEAKPIDVVKAIAELIVRLDPSLDRYLPPPSEDTPP